MKNEKKIDIRNLKFNQQARISGNLFVTRIMGGYLYETIYEGSDFCSTSLVFVPGIKDQDITEDNKPDVILN